MTKVYSFLIPDQVPALKNNREAVIGKGGKFLGTRPAAGVERFIRSTKDKFRRSLPSDFQVIKTPQEVAVVMLIGVYVAGYPKTLPKADLDNAATTLQECLFTAKSMDGPVLQDDRQVAESTVRRMIFKDPEAVYNQIWLWEIHEDHRDIEAEVMREVNNMLDANRRNG
jgi:hypothetical protein